MVKLLKKRRKSKVLTPSQLRCLSKIPTVNITSGCAHGCIYCYTKGYSQYPGDDQLVLFTDTAEKIAGELLRRRSRPQAVYFCPSCDPFQPIPEILDQTYKTMETLLKGNIGLQFVTKAMVPTNFIDLFAKYPGSVRAQVGLTCVDDNIRRIFEPGAAEIGDRLSTLRNLLSVSVKTSARADPLIHTITDSNESLTGLFSGIKSTGVKEVAVSYLFLRPAIRRSLERDIKNKNLLHELLRPYSNAKTLPIGTRSSRGATLPEGIRRKAFDRIKDIASDSGISVHFCGCKNPDITSESCYITRLTYPAQLDLFSQHT